VAIPVIPALRRLRQEDYIVRLWLQKWRRGEGGAGREEERAP
jgi:hypothetical protein